MSNDNLWKITALYFGQMTLPRTSFSGTLDFDLNIDIPILGFLLRNGKENALVDTGMRVEYFAQLAIGDVNPKAAQRSCWRLWWRRA